MRDRVPAHELDGGLRGARLRSKWGGRQGSKQAPRTDPVVVGSTGSRMTHLRPAFRPERPAEDKEDAGDHCCQQKAGE